MRRQSAAGPSHELAAWPMSWNRDRIPAPLFVKDASARSPTIGWCRPDADSEPDGPARSQILVRHEPGSDRHLVDTSRSSAIGPMHP